MTPASHFLASWFVASSRSPFIRQDYWAIIASGLAPDLDGIGYPIERITSGSYCELNWYTEYHHVVAHGILAAAGVAMMVWLWRRDIRVVLLSMLAFHLHLICDLVGSGGPNDEIWPILYFWPFSHIEWSLSWQWPLHSPINIFITLCLEIIMLWLAYRHGYSPLSLFSFKADKYLYSLAKRMRPN